MRSHVWLQIRFRGCAGAASTALRKRPTVMIKLVKEHSGTKGSMPLLASTLLCNPPVVCLLVCTLLMCAARYRDAISRPASEWFVSKSIRCLTATRAAVGTLRELLQHHHENVSCNATISNHMKTVTELGTSDGHRLEWASALKKCRCVVIQGLFKNTHLQS